MSHAVVLVAIRPTDDVEAAIAEQMQPFDENGEWFADGSRWDWYQIGGPKDVTAFAFLRDRTWNECERMGWFGISAETERERAGAVQAKVCTHIDEATGAKIVSWGDGSDRWDAKFYKRFIAPLPGDVLLVVVDFHV